MNGHLQFDPVTNRSDKPRIGLFLFASPEKYSYRYMYERLMERSEGRRTLSLSFSVRFLLDQVKNIDVVISLSLG